MNENGLSQQELVILNYFTNRHTIEEGATDLGIPYSTVTRYVRELKKTGFIVESGFRENRKRYYITVKTPGNSSQKTTAFIFWDGNLQTISKALSAVSKRPEVPIRADILIALYWLRTRANQMVEGDTPDGPAPRDISIILRRIQVKIRQWDRLISEILNAPIWYDTPDVADKLSDFPEPPKNIRELMNEFNLRYFAEEVEPLEAKRS